MRSWRAEMTVNHLPVDPCACGSSREAHWSLADIGAALGRFPVDADCITVSVVVEEHPEEIDG